MYGGQYGQFNETVSLHYDSGPSNSNMDYEQSFGAVQQNLTFNANLVEETTISGGRGGRTTRSSRGRGEI